MGSSRPPRAGRQSPLATSQAVLALVVAACALGCSSESAELPETAVTIAGQTVGVEVVRTRSEQALGLGERDSLAWGRGMVFPYDEPGFPTFWMKGMRFDIDIVWIRERRIVGISHAVPYPREDPSRPATVKAPGLTDMVLEVPAGYATASGWRKGNSVTLHGID
jgi:uncharacterized membrane protein (UPF0127 family)